MTEQIQKIKKDYISLVHKTFSSVTTDEKIKVVNEMFPLEDQPRLHEFSMLCRSGVRKWSEVCVQGGVVFWLDVFQYIRYLMLTYPNDFQFDDEVLDNFTEFVFRRGTSGFFPDWRRRD